MRMSSFRVRNSHDVPKYNQEVKPNDTDSGSKKYILDIESGEIVNEYVKSETSSKKYFKASIAEFGASGGVRFVSSDDEKRFALINKNNELITEFKFDGCGKFRKYLAPASINGKWGYINPKGDFVIEPKYKKAEPFINGLALVEDMKTGKAGFIDTKGELIIGFYDYLGYFSDGLVFAKNKKTRSYKFFNEKGELACLFKEPLKNAHIDEIKKYHDFIYQEFKNSTSHCELDEMGFKLINDGFYSRDNLSFCIFHDNLCQFIDNSRDIPKIGFIDKSGNIAIPAEFDFVSHFFNGIALYSNGENIYDCKSGILTTRGDKIEIGDFYWEGKNLAGLKRSALLSFRTNRLDGKPNANGKYGYINQNAKIVIKPQYDDVSGFGDGLFEFKRGLYSGIINKKEECIIPAVYDKLRNNLEYGYIVVKKYGKNGKLFCGIMDKKGNTIVPVDNEDYEELRIINKNRFIARKGDGYGLFDITGEPVSDIIFGTFWYMIDSRYGLVNLDIPKREYEPTGRIFRMDCGEGTLFRNHEKDGIPPEEHGHDFGIMNSEGKILTGEIFEHIGEYSDGLINGQYNWYYNHYIDHNGKPVLFFFTDNCSVFLDGVAFIMTHSWAYRGIYYSLYNFKLRKAHNNPLVEYKLPLKAPLDDKRTKFFINKKGDILDLSLEEQTEFLRKYYKWRNRKSPKWTMEEFKVENNIQNDITILSDEEVREVSERVFSKYKRAYEELAKND